MSLRECIVNAKAEGTITDKQATDMLNIYEGLFNSYAKTMGPGAASKQAGRDTFKATEKNVYEKKRKKLLQAKAWQQISLNMNQYKDRLGRENMFAAALAHFEQDRMSKFSSITQREAAIKGLAYSEIPQILSTYRRNLLGEVREKATFEDLTKEIFGTSTKNQSAKEMAEAWKKVSEYLRKKFNRAGGNIPYRPDWGLPQRHNAAKIVKAGYNKWRDDIIDKLDLEKMVDEQTGLPFIRDAGRLELALREVYETIKTEGANKAKPGQSTVGKSLSNRMQDHRFLAFKNGQQWFEYQKQYGDANVFDTMISHIENMSRDIALLEILGPNPGATVSFIKDTLTNRAKLTANEKLKSKARKTNANIDELYSAVTGKNNAPIDGFFASTFAGLRQVIQSAQLGSTAIAALTDINFNRMARQFTGLPQTKVLQQYLEQLNPLNAKERGELAISSGLIAEGWTSLAAGQMRFVGDMSGPEITRRISDFVMRASLLSPLTTAGRWAFGMEFMGTVGRNASKKFNELDPAFRNTMQRYNLNESQWDIIRSTKPYDEQGAKFIRPSDLASRTDLDEGLRENISQRFLEMINTETEFAVPSNSLRGRTFLTGDARPGTFRGEMARSFAMYKNFGVTLYNTHIMRGFNMPTAGTKGAYFANLIISTTLMGALALQLREIAKGRDPRDMFNDTEETIKFWTAALLQGGGLGIFGDFLASGTNRYGGGFAETLAGPVVSFGQDLYNLTGGNLVDAATGTDPKVASDLVKFTQRYLPGSSLWYSRLALERKIWDQLQLMTDPKAQQKFRRVERKYLRDYGQTYWWGPGDTAPKRKPRLENIFGN